MPGPIYRTDESEAGLLKVNEKPEPFMFKAPVLSTQILKHVHWILMPRQLSKKQGNKGKEQGKGWDKMFLGKRE